MSLHVASPVELAITVAAAALALTVSGNAFAQDAPTDATAFGARTATKDDLRAIPAAALKSRYLMCEQAAMQGRLDFATVLTCSMLYEELHQRVFGGSFDALVGWWRENKDPGASTR